MYQIKTKVISNRRIIPQYYKLIVNAPQIAKKACPGQFVNVRIQEGYEPFLRKPFSIYRIGPQSVGQKSNIELLYKVVGKGTNILSQKTQGEHLDVIGPLGKGYILPGKARKFQNSRNHRRRMPQIDLQNKQKPKVILVGGGIGIASLFFLAEMLTRDRFFSVTVLIGTKCKNELLCKDNFNKLGCQVKVATEDGSYGFKGLVTNLLKKEFTLCKSLPISIIYACGPSLMLKDVAKISEKINIPCQVCLEEYMACGVGTCLGCAVKIKSQISLNPFQGNTFPTDTLSTEWEYVRVCKEGPVFNAKQVIWNE